MLTLVLIAALSQTTTKDISVANPNAKSQAARPAQPVPPPITVTVTSPAKSEDEKKAEAAQREREITIQETIADWTAALFWVGALQVVAAFVAVFGAIRAANAAKKSAEIASVALFVSERAYLAIQHPKFKDADVNTPECFIDFVISNTGHTPGILLRSQFAEFMGVRPSGNMQGATINDEGRIAVHGGHNLARRINCSHTTRANTQAILTGKVPYSLQGWFTYETFGKEKTLRFCLTWDKGQQALCLDNVGSQEDGDNHALPDSHTT